MSQPTRGHEFDQSTGEVYLPEVDHRVQESLRISHGLLDAAEALLCQATPEQLHQEFSTVEPSYLSQIQLPREIEELCGDSLTEVVVEYTYDKEALISEIAFSLLLQIAPNKVVRIEKIRGDKTDYVGFVAEIDSGANAEITLARSAVCELHSRIVHPTTSPELIELDDPADPSFIATAQDILTERRHPAINEREPGDSYRKVFGFTLPEDTSMQIESENGVIQQVQLTRRTFDDIVIRNDRPEQHFQELVVQLDTDVSGKIVCEYYLHSHDGSEEIPLADIPIEKLKIIRDYLASVASASQETELLYGADGRPDIIS